MNDKEFREIFRELEGDWSDFWFAARLAVIGVTITCIFIAAIVALEVWLR